MTARSQNSSNFDLKLVENAIRLAINKLDAYKKPVIPNNHPDYLIRSIDTMSRFLKDVKLMPKNLFLGYR
jgi:hypothetical protein